MKQLISLLLLVVIVISRYNTAKSSCSSAREFLQQGGSYVPALLYSFPGSGNTWVRLLLDYATGIYTGSVYTDEKLLRVLPGEAKCDSTVLAIKAHPHLHSFEDLTNISSSSIDKCAKSALPQFRRAILLIRDPFNAIFSEFQRRASGGMHARSISKQGIHPYTPLYTPIHPYTPLQHPYNTPITPL